MSQWSDSCYRFLSVTNMNFWVLRDWIGPLAASLSSFPHSLEGPHRDSPDRRATPKKEIPQPSLTHHSVQYLPTFSGRKFFLRANTSPSHCNFIFLPCSAFNQNWEQLVLTLCVFYVLKSHIKSSFLGLGLTILGAPLLFVQASDLPAI